MTKFSDLDMMRHEIIEMESRVAGLQAANTGLLEALEAMAEDLRARHAIKNQRSRNIYGEVIHAKDRAVLNTMESLLEQAQAAIFHAKESL